MKNTKNIFGLPSKQALTVLSLGLVSITTSFAVGMHSSSSVQPFTLIEAGGNATYGDVNNDSVLDKRDVLLMLEMAAGYTTVTKAAYEADPNQDGTITIDDAISVLRELRY